MIGNNAATRASVMRHQDEGRYKNPRPDEDRKGVNRRRSVLHLYKRSRKIEEKKRITASSARLYPNVRVERKKHQHKVLCRVIER
jgi:hypothetical protein